MLHKWRRYGGAGLLGVSGLIALSGAFVDAQPNREKPSVVRSSVQCGHWCVQRIGAMLGVPLEVADLLRRMPYSEAGHSMLQLSGVLESLGFQCEGRLENIEKLAAGPFPCIAHLNDPEHFVVVVGVDERHVHVFDGDGRRRAPPRRDFAQRWSGNVVIVRRANNVNDAAPKAAQEAERSPHARFQSLLIDKGNLSGTAETCAFEFPLHNTGGRELAVKSLRTDCKCLTVEPPTAPILPGGRGTIKAVYRVQKTRGAFDHEILVETNDPRQPVIRLSAAGYADAGVEVVPAKLNLGSIPLGKPHTAYCFLRHAARPDDFEILSATSSLQGISVDTYSTKGTKRLPRWVDGPWNATNAGDAVHIVEISVNSTGGGPRNLQGTVEIETNVPGFEHLSVPVTGELVPPVRAFPDVILFGPSRTQSVTLRSLSDEPFRIRQARCDGGDIRATYSSEPSCSVTVDFVLSDPTARKPHNDRLHVDLEMAHSGTRFTVDLPVVIHVE